MLNVGFKGLFAGFNGFEGKWSENHPKTPSLTRKIVFFAKKDEKFKREFREKSTLSIPNRGFEGFSGFRRFQAI